MKTVYSTAQVAELLSVNESTVKRWTDQGHIDCMRTKGGHRRFSFPAIMRFIHENHLELPEVASTFFDRRELHAQLVTGNKKPLASEVMVAAQEGRVETVLHLFQMALAADSDLLSLYDDLAFPPLVEIGKAWEQGKISIDVEHLSSNTIKEALARLHSDLRYKDLHGLSAIGACYEDEEHDLALYCASSYLTVEGWQVFHLGGKTPTSDLIGAIARRKPSVLLLSARIIENEKKFLRDVKERIFPAVHRARGKLAIGGPDLQKRFGEKLKADFIMESIQQVKAFDTISSPHKARRSG